MIFILRGARSEKCKGDRPSKQHLNLRHHRLSVPTIEVRRNLFANKTLRGAIAHRLHKSDLSAGAGIRVVPAVALNIGFRFLPSDAGALQSIRNLIVQMLILRFRPRFAGYASTESVHRYQWQWRLQIKFDSSCLIVLHAYPTRRSLRIRFMDVLRTVRRCLWFVGILHVFCPSLSFKN